MSIIDKIRGKTKQAAGRALDDPELHAKGKRDEFKGKAKAKVQDTMESAEDRFDEVKDRVRGERERDSDRDRDRV
jgi:uncharacterized protein YjbJ (UPF0337 family)